MGRRVYWSVVILVVMTLRQNNPDAWSSGKIKKMFDISRQTLSRWVEYFRDVFPSSANWQRIRGRISCRVSNSQLPGAVVNYFVEHSDTPDKGIVECLGLLAAGWVGS